MNRASPSPSRRAPWRPVLVLVLTLAAACAGPRQATYATPSSAVAAFASMLEHPDLPGAEALFGRAGVALLRSGDDVADRADGLAVLAAIEEEIAFEEVAPDVRVAVLGRDAWPFPIPLVATTGGWRFDVEAGREELENRRIGRNELSCLATLHAAVDAQREYREAGHAGDPPAYAARLVSSEGARDGLFWPTGSGEPPSPLGPLVAAAAREGYRPGVDDDAPYHGYHFRILTAQGAHAPGGARSYLDDAGRLTGGFALLAWPATYGVSGIMTFQVNHRGIVFEKDLGSDTEARVAALTVYDPDRTWGPTPD